MQFFYWTFQRSVVIFVNSKSSKITRVLLCPICCITTMFLLLLSVFLCPWEFSFTWCLPLCPVLHRPSEGYVIERSLGQWDGWGWGSPQCAGGQVQQCDDALCDAAAAAIHLPELPAALSVSTAPADPREESHSTLQPRVSVIKVPETYIPQRNFSRTTPLNT